MAMNPQDLANKLIALSEEDLTPEESNKRFAEIITEHIQTSTISVTVEGVGNQGVMVVSKGEGTIT